jgi:hypothetical protein
MPVLDYIRALRPGLDGSIAMAIGVGLLKWGLPSSLPMWLRLTAEIAAGALVYAGVVFTLHRERAMNFWQLARRGRRPKMVPATT